MPETPAEKREKLSRWLQTALELEFATIPPYLTALLSIKLPANREAAELIRSVMIEEMLHFALVANIINAVGGTPTLDETTLPHYPLQMKFEGAPFKGREFPINLEPFSAAAIATFMKIEQPEERLKRPATFSVTFEVPALTIGEFYRRILALLKELDAELPGKLFVGDPARQIHKDFYWSGGGGVVAVSDLASATQAIDLVISQGEGGWTRAQGAASTGFGSYLDMGHYYRFSEIHYARRYRPEDDPDAAPTGDPIAIDYAAAYPVAINPKASDYGAGTELAALNDAFNMRYTDMLLQLREAIGGSPKALYTAIMNGMHALTPIAHEMMKLPLEAGDGRVGCPSFDWLEARGD